MYFFTDLDNTMIYSHRHGVSEPLIWVEWLNDRKQSFMTEKTYSYYKKQKWLKIVPVTTRTYSQYSRLLNMCQDLGWKDALICNGAIRVVNGVEDSEWTKESLGFVEKTKIPFREAVKLAMKKFGDNSMIVVDPFMFYVKTDNVSMVYSMLMNNIDKEYLEVYKDSRKVYCIQKVLNKGHAIKRYKERFGVEVCAAAGDSVFDISMLQEADFSYLPDSLSFFVDKEKMCVYQGMFSNQICVELEKIRKEEFGCD